ncbi:MAG: leucine-rich repeat protein [Bacteroidales bacterium]|nr:leucine-rich repeat protein [Bacteroidales bacterium]
MKKQFLILVMMVFAIGNAQAYDFMAMSPSHHVLYLNILDAENHIAGVTYPYHGGGNYYYNQTKPEGDLVIPETVTIGSNTWTITEILDHAFYDCPLTSVVIPNTVTAIRDNAFYGCPMTATVPNSVTVIEAQAFSYTRLQQLTLSESINTVGDRAFSCSKLTDLILPAKDIPYGIGCFSNTDLVTVVLPEGLTVVSKEMFANCPSLEQVVFPSTLTTIKDEAFRYCGSLQEINLPSSVTSIQGNWNPFRGDSGLESIQMDGSNEVYYCENNCLIERATNTIIAGCKNSVIPDGVVAIGAHAFAQCGLTHMPEIPASVTTLGEGAFYGCLDSGSFTLSETVTNIAGEAFSFGRFSTVTIPETIHTIPYRMFAFCQWMGEVTIPASVTDMGESSFLWCTKLKKIYVYNPVPPTVNTSMIYHSFDRVPRSATIYVPQGSLAAYQEAPGWNEFPNIVEMGLFPIGTEWYYEIENADGSITYQHLEYAADTTINDDPVHILVRINTLYDKDFYTEKTLEYIYESDNKVYWWNKDLEEFTMLYDFAAEVGDEWEIKVGTASLLMHVDAEGTVDYNGQTYRTLTVSDPDNLFSGIIICGIGHETSFFPEWLMSKDGDYRVEGMRCVWQYGQLIIQLNETSCDEVYLNFHYDIEESPADGISVYPNPTNGIITISGDQTGEYHITNIMGQTLMTGRIDTEKQQFNVSTLPAGVYFININGKTTKFVKY